MFEISTSADEMSPDGFMLRDDESKTQDKYWYIYDPNMISRNDVRKLFHEHRSNNDIWDNTKILGKDIAQAGAEENMPDNTWYMYDPTLLFERDVRDEEMLLKGERDSSVERNDDADDGFWKKNNGIPYKDQYILDKQLQPSDGSTIEEGRPIQDGTWKELNGISGFDDRRSEAAPETIDAYPYAHDFSAYPTRSGVKTTNFILNNAEALNKGYELLPEDITFNNDELKTPKEHMHTYELLTERDVSGKRGGLSTVVRNDEMPQDDDRYQSVYDSNVKTRYANWEADDGLQMMADVLYKPNVRTAEDVISETTHYMQMEYDNRLTDNDDQLTNDYDVPLSYNQLGQIRKNKHMPNWYKPLSASETKNKRSKDRQSRVNSAFANNPYHFRRNLPKRARWIRTRYGYWYAPSYSYDGRGPLDSLANALIG